MNLKIPNSDIPLSAIEPNADLSGADLSDSHLPYTVLNDSNLSRADLSGSVLNYVNLKGAYLSEANLRKADLPNAKLHRADLSGADLEGSDFSEAYLGFANFSGANLRFADLSKSVLAHADFSGADLTGADLEGALIFNTSLSNSILSQKTNIDPPEHTLSETHHLSLSNNPLRLSDAVAQSNHELKKAYSNSGLSSQARKARLRERRARRKRAKLDDTYIGTLQWLASVVSRWTTGYGVKLLPVIGTISVLYFVSSFIYATEMSFRESLYYSVVTLTTSPPFPPDPGLIRFVAGVETILGTTAIIFLGYVLANRERI